MEEKTDKQCPEYVSQNTNKERKYIMNLTSICWIRGIGGDY